MGWHLPFGRSAHASSGAAASNDNGARTAPYDPRPREWARLSPIATVTKPHELTSDIRFGDGLNARPREFFLQPLSHEVTLDAPHGLITPARPQAPARAAETPGLPLVSQRLSAPRRSPLQRLMTSAWTSEPATPPADGVDVGDSDAHAVLADRASSSQSGLGVTPAPMAIGLQRSAAAVESHPVNRTSLITAPSRMWSDVPDVQSKASVAGLAGASDGGLRQAPATRDAVSLAGPQSVVHPALVQRATLGQSRRLGLGPPLAPRVSRDTTPNAPAVTVNVASISQTAGAFGDTQSTSQRVDPTYVQSSAETHMGGRPDLPEIQPLSVHRGAGPDDVAQTTASVARLPEVAIPSTLQHAVPSVPPIFGAPRSPISPQRTVELSMLLAAQGQLSVAQRAIVDQLEAVPVTELLGATDERPAQRAVDIGGRETHPTREGIPVNRPGDRSAETTIKVSTPPDVQRTPAMTAEPRSRPLLGTTSQMHVSPIRAAPYVVGASPDEAVVAQRAVDSAGVDAQGHDRFLSMDTMLSSAVSRTTSEPPFNAVQGALRTTLRPSSFLDSELAPSRPAAQRNTATAVGGSMLATDVHGAPSASLQQAQRVPSWEQPAAAPLLIHAPRATTAAVQRIHDDAPAQSPATAGASTWSPQSDVSASSLVAQRAPESASSAPRESQPAAAGGAHAPATAAGGDLDALAHDMYQRIRSELRMELLLDRERAGLVTDLR